MDWIKLKKENPKSFELFENWGFYLTTISGHNKRLLYDFFDRYEIYISINADGYEYNAYHRRHLEEGGDVYYWWNIQTIGMDVEDDIDYSTRMEAEHASFAKAFEILEEKL